jgi:hypothetical protein
MQDDGAAVAENPTDVGAQGFNFGSGDQPALAADDGDAADISRFEFQLHSASGEASHDDFFGNGSRAYKGSLSKSSKSERWRVVRFYRRAARRSFRGLSL